MRRAALALATLVACHPVERASAPEFGDAKSALLLALGGQETHAIAVAAGKDGLQLPPLVQKSDLELWALTFACSLDRTGLAPGELEVRSAAGGDGFGFDPLASYYAPLATDDAVQWSATPLTDDARSVLTRLPATDACTTAGAFSSPRRVLLPSDETEVYAFAVRVDEDRAVVAAYSGNYFWITRAGTVERFTLDTGRPLVAAFVRDDGLTFAVDQAGATYAGNFDEGFTSLGVTATTAIGSVAGQLVGPKSDAEGEFELFLATNGERRGFARFDGERWTALGSRRIGRFEPVISVAWVGPGEAVSFGIQDAQTASRYRDGRLVEESVGTRSSVVSVHQHPRYGTVATVSSGRVYHHDGTQWSNLFDAGDYANAAAPVGAAIWVTAVFDFSPPASAALFWDDARGTCGEVQVDGFNRDLVALDDTTYLLVNQIDFNGTFFVDVIDLEVPFVDCGAPQ